MAIVERCVEFCTFVNQRCFNGRNFSANLYLFLLVIQRQQKIAIIMPGMNGQSESGEAQPISMIFVTMSVGAVMLLFMLVFGIGRVASKEEKDQPGKPI